MTVLTTTAKAGPYAGAGTTGPFAVPFRFLDASHLRVIRSVGAVETVLVLGTDYTVAGVGASSGSVTLTAALPVGQNLTVVRNVPATQEADYVAGDAFPAESHEEALDKLTMLTQQLQEEVARSAKLPASNPSDADALSAALLRVDANATNINAAVANEANINSAVGNATNINTVAGSIANVNATGSNISNVNAVAGNASNINTVAGNNANVTTVAGSIANVNAVGTNIANVNAAAGNATNINAVVANASNINAVAGNNANITAVAGNASNINAVNSNAANVNAVAGQITPTNNVQTVAGVAPAVSTVAGISAAVSTVAAADANVSTVAGSIASVNTVAGNNANVTAVAGNAANITAVAGNAANINAVAGNATNINAVNANAANINAVNANAANINAVAGNASNINTVATNLADVTNFADVYQGPKTTNPTLRNNGSALQAGDLYFNTVAIEMRVWNGTAWQPQAASPDTLTERNFLATAGQTSYTFVGGYRVGYTFVWVNGVLLNASDITATDGATITFAAPLALNDEVRILSFKAVGTVAVSDISGLQDVLDSKADQAATYTKTEVDSALSAKANSADVSTALALKANTADVDAALALKANTASPSFTGVVGIGADWTVEQSGNDLLFKRAGVNRMRLSSSGDLTVSGNVTAYGTV